MKHVWLIFGQAVFGLALAACGVAVEISQLTPTEAPVVVTQVATAGQTENPTPTDAATSAGPRARDTAPDFSLPDHNGVMVHLADELKMAHRAVVLVFYFDYT
ncbi:MAG: hypothetical protein U0401_05250 [Anaerolineae bacterium]